MKYIRYSIGKTYLKALSEKTKKMPKILFYAFQTVDKVTVDSLFKI